MISVKNLSKKYSPEVTALDDVSFEISTGEVCGYIGTNGAGKSTTVKIITGALGYDKGEVTVAGIDVKSSPVEVKKITGYVPETANVFNSLTSTEFLDFVGTVHNLPKDVIKKRVEYFAELFEFKDYLKESIGNLSKGNRQKILITSALIHNPSILFFDEPLNGLDANAIFTFQDVVKVLSEKGKTIFYCSHLLDTIEKVSSRIIIIEKGKIRLNSSTEELKKTKDFISLENMFRSLKSESDTKKFIYEDIFG